MISALQSLFKKFKRLVTYSLVGAVNTLVDYTVFAVLFELLSFSSGVSQTAGFLSGSVCGYMLNSRVTFRQGKGRSRAQWAQYVGIDVILAFLSSAFMNYLSLLGINVYIIKIMITVIVFFLHYTLYKYVVFRIKKEDDRNDGQGAS